MKTATKLDVDRQLMADAAERAEQAFKDHVVTQHLAQGMYRSWRCMKPGTWCYGFDVTTRPGWLFLTGDIGELIVTRECEVIAWARSAIRDPGYFASKVPSALPTKEWSFDKSLEWINETLAEAGDYYGDKEDATEARVKLRELKRALKEDGINGEMSEHEFSTALYDSSLIDGCDWPNLKVFNNNFLWTYHAVKWFLAHLPEEAAPSFEQAESGNA